MALFLDLLAKLWETLKARRKQLKDAERAVAKKAWDAKKEIEKKAEEKAFHDHCLQAGYAEGEVVFEAESSEESFDTEKKDKPKEGHMFNLRCLDCFPAQRGTPTTTPDDDKEKKVKLKKDKGKRESTEKVEQKKGESQRLLDSRSDSSGFSPRFDSRHKVTDEPVMFSATVQKGGAKLGADINYHDKVTFLIMRVNAGPCHDYNLTDPDVLIAPGDRIVSVNGVSGDINQMLQAIKAAELKMTVRKCDEKIVTLMKSFPKQKLGIEVKQCDTVTLVISSLGEAEDSVVAEYNSTSSGVILEKGLRIIGVNNIYGEPERLQAELMSSESWTLITRRVFEKSP